MGHFPWFVVYNLCETHLPEPADLRGRLIRNATMGFAGAFGFWFWSSLGVCTYVFALTDSIDAYLPAAITAASFASDGLSNSLTVVKVCKQASADVVSYRQVRPCLACMYVYIGALNPNHMIHIDCTRRRPSASSQRTASGASWGGGLGSACLRTGCR